MSNALHSLDPPHDQVSPDLFRSADVPGNTSEAFGMSMAVISRCQKFWIVVTDYTVEKYDTVTVCTRRSRRQGRGTDDYYTTAKLILILSSISYRLGITVIMPCVYYILCYLGRGCKKVSTW